MHIFKVILVTHAASKLTSGKSGPKGERTAFAASEQSHNAHLLHGIAREAHHFDSLGGDKRCSCL